MLTSLKLEASKRVYVDCHWPNLENYQCCWVVITTGKQSWCVPTGQSCRDASGLGDAERRFTDGIRVGWNRWQSILQLNATHTRAHAASRVDLHSYTFTHKDGLRREIHRQHYTRAQPLIHVHLHHSRIRPNLYAKSATARTPHRQSLGARCSLSPWATERRLQSDKCQKCCNAKRQWEAHLTFYSAETIIVPHRMIWSWYTGRWWVGCYIWYSEEGTGRGRSPPRPLLAVPNVTAHPSTASVQITVLLYNGSLCGFKVPIKGWIATRKLRCCHSGWDCSHCGAQLC